MLLEPISSGVQNDPFKQSMHHEETEKMRFACQNSKHPTFQEIQYHCPQGLRVHVCAWQISARFAHSSE